MFKMNKKIKGSKNLNVPNKGEQSQTCLSYADRAEHLRKENVPNLRFPEFSGEWEKTTIGKILTIGNGRDYKHLTEGNIPVFGTGGYMLSVNEYLYDGESVFIGRKGTINKPFFFSGKFWTVDTLFYTHKFVDVLPYFVYGLFQRINWNNYNEASGVPSLSKSTIEKISINVPIVEEQRKIANLMSLLDDRIATQIKIIEDLKKLKSAIRAKVFKQLESSCEFCSEIGNMLQYEQPSKYLVTSTEYSDSYTTPVLTANKAFILGYTDEEFGIYSKGECVIFDDFTMDVKYVNFPFKVKSSAIKILTANSGNDLYFVYEYLQNLGLVSEEHKRHYISEIEPMVVACPTFEEQQNISNLFRSFDSKIECANRELILYNKQKQHLLSQMFI